MVAPTSHDSSRADPTRRAVMRIPTLVKRVFGSVTVWRSPRAPSLTSLVWAHAKRTAHGEVRSPCAVRSARHAEKQGELGLCQTSRRARARNPGVRTRKKGYASPQLVGGSGNTRTVLRRQIRVTRGEIVQKTGKKWRDLSVLINRYRDGPHASDVAFRRQTTCLTSHGP